MNDLALSNSLANLAARISEEHAQATGAIQRGIEHALVAGDLLIEAKAKVGHGGWLSWLAEQCKVPERSAQVYIKLALHRQQIEIRSAADLSIRSALKQIEALGKKEKRAQRELDLSTKITALPDKRYGVIVADPEWRFEPWSRETGMDRAADNHYPTSILDVIAARPVGDIAADDCVLFLWATTPMLPHALVVMAAWGFDYRTNFIWGKDRIGTGYWNRNRHEQLLVGVQGNIPAPAMGTQWDSLQMAPAGQHSVKPDCFLEMVEAYFPTLPKIELNRRGPPRPGWDAWGNEVEEATAA